MSLSQEDIDRIGDKIKAEIATAMEKNSERCDKRMEKHANMINDTVSVHAGGCPALREVQKMVDPQYGLSAEIQGAIKTHAANCGGRSLWNDWLKPALVAVVAAAATWFMGSHK